MTTPSQCNGTQCVTSYSTNRSLILPYLEFLDHVVNRKGNQIEPRIFFPDADSSSSILGLFGGVLDSKKQLFGSQFLRIWKSWVPKVFGGAFGFYNYIFSESRPKVGLFAELLILREVAAVRSSPNKPSLYPFSSHSAAP